MARSQMALQKEHPPDPHRNEHPPDLHRKEFPPDPKREFPNKRMFVQEAPGGPSEAVRNNHMLGWPIQARLDGRSCDLNEYVGNVFPIRFRTCLSPLSPDLETMF